MHIPAFCLPTADLRATQAPLPACLRVLYVAGNQRLGCHLAEAFAAQSDSTVFLEEAVGAAAGLARLHDDPFDIVLAEHDADGMDALPLVAGIQAAGGGEPVIVLGSEPPHELLASFLAAGAENYVSVPSTTPQALQWIVARAFERTTLAREHRRLEDAQRQRQQQEQVEAGRLLQEQRTALQSLGSTRDAPLASQLVDHYRELLQAYIVMGSGNLSDELARLVRVLLAGDIGCRQVMQMHLQLVDEIVRSLGGRSARHVLARADLLALEVVVKLAEVYRERG